MGYVRLFYRGFAFVLLTILCTVVALLGSFVGGHIWALRTQQFWSRILLAIFGVKTVIHGNPTNAGLIMANHQSYIDIWLIPRYVLSVFVAKAEVKRMPLVGWGATVVDTVHVDRSSKESRKATKDMIADRLRNGRSVIIFPEGTTGSGEDLLPFKPGMFHVAAEEGFPLIPVTIFYEDTDMAWVGNDNMGSHFARNFKRASTIAHIHFGEPVKGADGELLMQEVEGRMKTRLQRFNVNRINL